MQPNFRYLVTGGIAMPAQSVTSAAVNGNAINTPWEKGRVLAFLWVGGAIAASGAGVLKLQVQKRSDASWTDLLDSAGGVVKVSPNANFADAGAAENGLLLGTVRLENIDSTLYKAIRTVFTESGAGAINGGIAYLIFNQYDVPPSTPITDTLAAVELPVIQG